MCILWPYSYSKEFSLYNPGYRLPRTSLIGIGQGKRLKPKQNSLLNVYLSSQTLKKKTFLKIKADMKN